MPTLRTIKKQIKSVKNTKQMTRAMEAVAANKMRRVQGVALAARPYAEKAFEILGNLSLQDKSTRHFLLNSPDVKKQLVVLITSDKGLCGALNAGLVNTLSRWLVHPVRSSRASGLEETRDKVASATSNGASKNEIEFLAVGGYGAKWLEKNNLKIIETLRGTADIANFTESHPIAEKILKYFASKNYQKVSVLFSNFVSVLKQEPGVKQILPITRESMNEIVSGIGGMKTLEKTRPSEEIPRWHLEYEFEPTPGELLNLILPALLEIGIYHMILEANASEHAARMVAMKNATDNADNLITDLTLTYNKARQSAITRELTEITAGKEVLSEH